MTPNEAPAQSRPSPTRAQMASLCALVLIYALLSNYSGSGTAPKWFSVSLSFGPLVLIGAILIWRWTRPWLALVGIALGGTAIYHGWGFLERNYEVADLIQQCGAYGLVAVSFAHSLVPEKTPLCILLAQQIHGELTPLETLYNRRATLAWAVFYALIAASIVILYFVTTRKMWSLFANFAVFGVIAGACLLDYLLRLRLLPRRPGDGFFGMLRRALVG